MTPIPLPPFTLADVEPSALVRGALSLVLAVALVWTGRRMGRPMRILMQGTALLFLMQALFVHNPWCWDLYADHLGARDVGWRQRDVIRVERDRFLKKPASLDYLVVGSSQAGAIFLDYAADHQDLDTFTMAGLFPLDFMLYREQILAYQPRAILLHLSEFDMARVHSPRRAVMAPSQGLSLLRLFVQLRGFPQGKDYDQAVLEMALGEAFPEFKYRFVFRGLVNKALRKNESLPEESPEMTQAWEPASAAALTRQIEQFAGGIRPDSLPFNFFFLEKFLDFCAEYGVKVIILEGQYMPAARAIADQKVNETVRGRLQALAGARGGVVFIPRDAVFEFDDADFVDVAHVKPENGYEYASQVLDYLKSTGR